MTTTGSVVVTEGLTGRLSTVRRRLSQQGIDVCPSRHLQRLSKEVQRCTDVVGVFSNPADLLRLAGVLLVEAHE